jgi:hypothetical protein
MNVEDRFAIAHTYAIYARAIDEKRYDLLAGVFTPDAHLEYLVGPHAFECRGADAESRFRAFLDLCYWTNHLIAMPMIEARGDGAFATARVVATHLQQDDCGGRSRWTLRGSYHDSFVRSVDGWRIASRYCICSDAAGEFRTAGVRHFPALAWADAGRLGGA